MSKHFYIVYRKDKDPASTTSVPWNETNSIVVVATSSKKARELAQFNSGIEGEKDKHFWLNPEKTICKKLDIKNYKVNDIVIHNFGDEG